LPSRFRESNRTLLTEPYPAEAPALILSWCPTSATFEIPSNDLGPPVPLRTRLQIERPIAWVLAQGLRVQGGLFRP
jgi:hypothetical protein